MDLHGLEPIQFIVAKKYPKEFSYVSSASHGELFGAYTDVDRKRYLAAVKMLRDQIWELQQLPVLEIRQIVRQIQNEEREWEINNSIVDQEHFVAVEATYTHWCSAAYWTNSEASALLIERKPEGLESEFVQEKSRHSETFKEYKRLQNLLARAEEAKIVKGTNTPQAIYSWAKNNMINIPERLTNRMKELGLDEKCWQERVNELEHTNKALKQQFVDLQKSLSDERSAANTPASATSREKQSLLKIVFGMAIKGYCYDPAAQRNSTAGEIESDLALIGLNMDQDTIRKYLREAADSFANEASTESR